MRSRSEIENAICSLSSAQLIKLRNFARIRVRGLGSRAGGADYEDLLQQALASTISGEREWSDRVDLYAHLLGAMRSIASCWKDHHEVELFCDSDLHTPEGESSGILENAATKLDPERILAAKEEMQRIRRALRGDVIAADVLELIAFGFTSKEVQERLKITQQQYGAATRRIRRRLELLFPEWNGRRSSLRKGPTSQNANIDADAFACPNCGGKIEQVPISLAERLPLGHQWKCNGCATRFGPPWAMDEPPTGLLGPEPWGGSHSTTTRVEWMENRDDYLFLVIAEREDAGWKFFEKDPYEGIWRPVKHGHDALTLKAERLANGDALPLDSTPLDESRLVLDCLDYILGDSPPGNSFASPKFLT
jgi:DNA-directed RNA polymerase specialized sigma24 family protein/predicted RNA-binding Zn-ribbon protein involved in translation (DUF1610 family)